MKILKYATQFAGELRSGVREHPTVEEILAANAMQPEVDTAREFWIPSPEQAASLVAIEDVGARATTENTMFDVQITAL